MRRRSFAGQRPVARSKPSALVAYSSRTIQKPGRGYSGQSAALWAVNDAFSTTQPVGSRLGRTAAFRGTEWLATIFSGCSGSVTESSWWAELPVARSAANFSTNTVDDDIVRRAQNL